MRYILDTNICVHMLKTKSFNILKHAKKNSDTQISISSITECELWFGVWNSKNIISNQENLKYFLQSFSKVSFDSSFAFTYGFLRAEQKKSGRNIGHNDLLIAAQALDMDAILITNNEKEFKQIKDLRIENWLRAIP